MARTSTIAAAMAASANMYAHPEGWCSAFIAPTPLGPPGGGSARSAAAARARSEGTNAVGPLLGAAGRGPNESAFESSTTRDPASAALAGKKRIVVVGGGWAGFSAADALASAAAPDPLGGGESPAQAEITLLDASPRGRGGLAGGWRTPGGRPVEAGIHGFWREYRNTFRAVEGIDGLYLDDVLTPYTPSVLVSKSGRVALAPVLGEGSSSDGEGGRGGVERSGPSGFELPPPPLSPKAALVAVAPLLPPPLDVALLSEFHPASPLTVADRLSAAGLLGAWADFGQEDPESWARYDGVSAEDLFRKYAGVSDGLYDELVSPLLHVLPMAPGYDCSAAAALSCFHVFALQSRGAFDVRWCRGGIAERIFDPWARQLVGTGNVKIRGGARVTSIERSATGSPSDGSAPPFEVQLNGGEETLRCDAVVLAVGGTAMEKIAAGSSVIRSLPAARNFDKLRGVTCVAVRIFLEPSAVTSGLSGGKHGATQLPPDAAAAMKDSPVFVCGPGVGGIPALEETGFCLYDLQRMHDEFAVDGSAQGKDGTNGTAVLEVDFFRADQIADMERDEDVVKLALRAAGAALGVNMADVDVVDMAVVRARNAVSHFALNSASYSPGVKIGDGIFMCGDWIDRAGHASWSTEKAVVTGRQAAGAVARDMGMICDTEIIPAAPDTQQLKTLRKVARFLRKVAPPPDGIPPSPWMFAQDILSRGRK